MKKNQPKGKVLLDSNILIHLLRKDKSVKQHIRQIGWRNCCVSEISVVELLYGADAAHIRKRTTLC